MELMTLKDVALAERKSVRGVQKDVVSGRFGPDLIRLGRSVRVRRNEFSDWLEAGAPPRERWLQMRDAGRKAVTR